ncbi:MAG: class F sortase [Minisyncoccia bacterium]
MRKSFLFFVLVAVLCVPHFSVGIEPVAALAPAFADEYVPSAGDYPARIRIPSIKLDSPIQHVGLTSGGAIDVPDGSTNLVGWYAGGAIPGEYGNAIMDAHVFAAFKNLHFANVGDEISIENANGERQRFVISDARVYALSEVPMADMVHADAGRRLVLITCAGKFNFSLGTYSHRLVVYANLIEENQ